MVGHPKVAIAVSLNILGLALYLRRNLNSTREFLRAMENLSQ
jgi:hypothetical protein